MGRHQNWFDCKNDSFYNLYSSEVSFGSETSRLRWVWIYSCNFLTCNSFVTDDSLKEMMTGAHILMGYASQSYLCAAMASCFANRLREGDTIVNAYFYAGSNGEATVTEDDHIQKVMVAPQAINETIFTPNIKYTYSSSDVVVLTHRIHDGYPER